MVINKILCLKNIIFSKVLRNKLINYFEVIINYIFLVIIMRVIIKELLLYLILCFNFSFYYFV